MNQDDDLQREIRSHIESETSENLDAGMNSREAHLAARRAFGNVGSIRERVREASPTYWIATLFQDVRYGLRALMRSPLLGAAVIMTLSLGIGLNAGIFSVLNGVMFRPRVQNDPATFVHLAPEVSGPQASRDSGFPFSVSDYRAYQTGARTVTNLTAWAPAHAPIDNSADTPILMLVTCNFFAVYGLDQPKMGRLFREEECTTPGSVPVVLLSEELWRSKYAGDPQIIGTTIKLRRQAFTVIGIIPERFPGRVRGPGIWIPYTMEAAILNGSDLFSKSDIVWLTIDGRLRPGQTRASAQIELSAIARQLDQRWPGLKTTMFVTDGSLAAELRGKLWFFGPLVMGALTLILLLACTNVTMLLLSRAVARRQEIAVRLSLGAGRGRLMRMLLTESLILASIAGAISAWAAYSLSQYFEKQFEPVWNLKPDWVVFAYLAAVTLLAACMAGLTPSIESMRVDLSESLKGEEGLAGAGRRGGMRGFLVGAQVAMSLVLLTGAGLFVRAQTTIFSEDPGFETKQVLLVPLDSIKPASFDQRVADEARKMPGVLSVTLGDPPPMFGAEGGVIGDELRLPGQAKGSGVRASTLAVSGNYFDTLRIAILHGRAFRDSDAPGAAVISQALAAALWPGRDPMGQRLLGPNDEPLEVAGIARDTKSDRFGEVDGPRVYRLRSTQSPGGVLMVRFAGDAGAMEKAIRNLIHGMDRELLPVPRTLESMRQEIASVFWRLARMVLSLGVVAILLAVIGIYGVMAFMVSRRMREIGIRMALGATKATIIRTVLGSGIRPVLIGLGVGSVLTAAGVIGLVQALKETPMAVNAADPMVYLCVAALLVSVALGAMFGPALRAAGADPVKALRHS